MKLLRLEGKAMVLDEEKRYQLRWIYLLSTRSFRNTTCIKDNNSKIHILLNYIQCYIHYVNCVCESVSKWASACWAKPLSSHATAMCECICILNTKYIFFLPPSCSCLPFLFPVGRLVWEEKDPEAETRAEGTEGRHLYACWQERKRWSRKVPEFQKKKKEQKNKKKTKRRQNICTFSSLCLTFYLYVFFSLEVTVGKNENIFVKR